MNQRLRNEVFRRTHVEAVRRQPNVAIGIRAEPDRHMKTQFESVADSETLKGVGVGG